MDPAAAPTLRTAPVSAAAAVAGPRSAAAAAAGPRRCATAKAAVFKVEQTTPPLPPPAVALERQRAHVHRQCSQLKRQRAQLEEKCAVFAEERDVHRRTMQSHRAAFADLAQQRLAQDSQPVAQAADVATQLAQDAQLEAADPAQPHYAQQPEL
ncbi:hypothetical protein M885DRAFT_565080, partial [Pelagophyceae sp. CCMP2097]